MYKVSLIIALVLSFAAVSEARELRGNPAGAQRRSQPAARPSVTARPRDARAQSGTLRANNTGIDSIRVAAETANQASACTRGQATRTPVACANVDRTNRYRNLNITNLAGCRRIAQGKASCYGTPSDGFGYDRDKLVSAIGIRFNPRDMTAACSPSLKGKIIVVRNVTTNQSRAVTCTDTGAFETKYGRVIDLAREAFNVFGPRCDKDGIMKNVELYTCPNT